MDSFLTTTFDHYQNPTGAAWSVVQADVACTPVDPLGREYVQEYPLEKLYLMMQVFTKYTAVEPGDRIVSGGVTYVAKASLPWGAQGGLDVFHHVILERVSGS